MSFENMIGERGDDGLESSSIERSGYPIIMWMNGDPSGEKFGLDSMEYVGGFFTTAWYRHNDKITQHIPDGADATEYPEIDLAPYGWKKDYFVNSANQKVHGWWRKYCEASFICARDRWIVQTEEEGKKKILAFTNYNDADKAGSCRGHMQVLALIKGMESFGPVVFSFKGYGMKAFKGQGEMLSFGVMSQLKRNIIDGVAKKLTKPGAKPPHINYRAVWCKFGPYFDAKGQPQFTKAGKGEKSKLVMVPAYAGPVGEIDIAAVYVGDEINAKVNTLFDENQEWAKAWANLTGAEDKAEAATAAADAQTEDLSKAAASVGL